MLVELRELLRYRDLILILIRRDLRIRYKNSSLGFFWSLVPLILQVIVLSIVIKLIYGVGPHDLSAYILCAYIPWNFIVNGVLDGSSSVIAQYGLLKKVYFPREVLPISAVLSNGIHLLLALAVFFIYRYVFTTLCYGWPGWPPISILWLPVLLLIALLLVVSIALFTSALNVFHEDVKFIAQSLLNLAFFTLPIAWFTEQIYFSNRIPIHWRHPLMVFYNAEPVSWLITAFRQVLLPPADIGHDDFSASGHVLLHHRILTASFDIRYMALALITSALCAILAYGYFNRCKWRFVERP